MAELSLGLSWADEQKKVEERSGVLQPLFLVVWKALVEEAKRQGLGEYIPEALPAFKAAELKKDTYEGTETFVGRWSNEDGNRFGEVVVHANGKVFAEYDLLAAHPKKPKWYAEAVTAWGEEDAIKSELRLIPNANYSG